MTRTVERRICFLRSSILMVLIFWIVFFLGNEDFVILACDGLWDTVEPETATSLTYDYIWQGNDRHDCAKMLVKEAKSCGSMDNISVIVVFLDDHKKISFNSSERSSVEKERTGSLESGKSHSEERKEKESTVNTVENEHNDGEKEKAKSLTGEN